MANSTTLYTLSDGRRAVDVTENKTLALLDSGVVQVVKTDALTITLPTVAAGLNFTVRNGGVPKTSGPTGSGDDFSAAINLSPAAADSIGGVLASPVANKDLINTKATAKVGDEVTVVGGGTTQWTVLAIKGIWAREV